MKKFLPFLFLFLLSYTGRINAQCSTTTAPTTDCSYGDQINAFSLGGVPSVGNSGCGAAGYNFFASPVRTLVVGQTYTWSATVGSGQYNEGVGIWIDYNNDGFYATTEFVASSPAAQNHTGTFTIPTTAAVATVRMRVRCAWNSAVTSGQACSNSIGSGYGETEDYNVTLDCPLSAPALTVTGASAAVCAGNTVALAASGLPTFTWSGGISNSTPFTASATTQFTVEGAYGAACPSITNSAVVTLSVNPSPTITGVSSGSICPGTSYVLTPSGASTYTYAGPSSSVTGASATLSPLSTTSYTVRGTSSNGCVSNPLTEVSLTVTTLASPTIAPAASPASVCPGLPTNLTASGANTYTWNGSTTGASIVANPTVTTVYTVVATGTNICNGVANVTVVVYPTPVVNVNSGLICSGYNFTMNPTGASTYTLISASGTVANVVSPLASTAYSVIGTSALGCNSNTNSPAVSNVTVNASPTITALSGTMCIGLGFSIMPVGANTYSLNGSSTTSLGLVNPSSNTTYSVTGTGTNGCVSPAVAVSDVTVYANPTITAVSSPTAICISQGTAAIAAGGASTYTWSTSDQTSGISVSPSVTSVYTVTGTSSLQCKSTATVMVLVNPLPVLTIARSSTFICVGGSATLTASGANTYAWNNGSNTSTIVVSPTVNTTYVNVGTSTAGCTSTLSSAINVNTITINTTPNSSICAGSQVSLTANGAVSYTWNTNFPFQTINVTPATNTVYSVFAIDANNCTHSKAVSVTIYQLPNVTASPNRTLICLGETATITASGAANYSWSNGSGGNSIVVTPTINVTFSYGVTGTDANNCSSAAITTMVVSGCVGVAENTSAFTEVKVFPNPSNGEFTISNSSPLTLNLVNELGQVVRVLDLNAQNANSVKVNGLANGIYFITDVNGGRYNQKVIIMK